MATSPIGNGTGNISTLTPTSRGLDALRSEDFFKLLITQLQSQDPFKPNDSNQLVQEMATIREMETNRSLDRTLSTFADQQKIGTATNLIGKYITGVVRSGGDTGGGGGQTEAVEGVVVGVRFSSTGAAVLELEGGQQLLAQDVSSVSLVDPQTGGPVVARLATADAQDAAARVKADSPPQEARAKSLALELDRWLHPPTAERLSAVA